jgi:hypothetical protein
MRAIGKLIAVVVVVAILGLGQRIELLAGGAMLLIATAIVIRRSDRKAALAARSRPTAEVIPLEAPLGMHEDLEGMTVPAPMSAEAAIDLHHRYAPSFDQQLALNRHLEEFGDEQYDPADSATHYDPQAYAEARAYADAFEAQLARGRRTLRYDAPSPPRERFPRGSEQHMPRRLEPSPSGWDPHKPASVTGMRRVK